MNYKVCFAVGFCLFLMSFTASAKTVVDTKWQFKVRCEWGDTEDRIVMTRYFDDGTYQVKWMYKKCDEDCWHETEWGDVSAPPTGTQLPTQAVVNGLQLLNAPLTAGGDFDPGSGPTCRGFTSALSTIIFVPSVILQ